MRHSKKKPKLPVIQLPKSCYLVGGFVRDQLLGIKTGDRDWLVVGSSSEEMKSFGFIQVGRNFPVFIHPQTGEQYALAREEIKKGKGYYGFKCKTKGVSLVDDLKRRDITINSMALNYQNSSHEDNQTLIDPFNGQADLENKIIRHTSDAFVEDPLRVIRLARFLAKFHHLGFRVHPKTIELLKKMVKQGEIDDLTSERIWLEVEKVSQTQNPEIFFLFLNQIGALDLLFKDFSFELEQDWFQALSSIFKQTNFGVSTSLALCFYGYSQKSWLISHYKLSNHLTTLFNLLDSHKSTLIALNQLTHSEKELKNMAGLLCQLFKDVKVLQEKSALDTFILIHLTIHKLDLSDPSLKKLLASLYAYLNSDVQRLVKNQKKIKADGTQNLGKKIEAFRENEVFEALKNIEID